MSNKDPVTRRLVKTQEFIDFLIEKNVKSNCLSCGDDRAFVSSDDDPDYAAQTKMEVAEFEPKTMNIKQESSAVVLALSVVCGNCGYIRSYVSQNIYDWLEERSQNSQNKE